MDIIVNYWAVLFAAVITFILGAVWYGPVFGKQWMKITGSDKRSTEENKKLMDEITPYYGIVFLFALLTNYVLYHFVKAWSTTSGMETAFWIWLGFSMPVAANAMWEGLSRQMVLKKFLIVSGYLFVSLMISGYIFTMW